MGISSSRSDDFHAAFFRCSLFERRADEFDLAHPPLVAFHAASFRQKNDPAGRVHAAHPHAAACVAEAHSRADGIRGFAILLVTAYRFNLGPVDADYGRLGRVLFKAFSVGNLGVDLFFVLSGFLITGILFDAKGSRHYFRDFYIRRALRIYPLYYGVLFVALVALPLLLGARYQLFPEARADQASLWLYVANFLMGFRNEWCLGSFRHFWSLCVEEHFYLIWPLIIFFCTRRQALAASLLTIALAIVGRVVWLMLGGPKVAVEAFTCFQCDGLALGSFLALVARGRAEFGPIFPGQCWE